ncbi:hypothetical protein BCR33DRAFT_779851 [Rhizoclosmatium globosum]|uniref:HTH La-type RNA-binding domain-containing protein n=1 Tax=Rhizoclosmatium globosum TaxID=329046 RepID=A0A1Y2D0D7_9FUNG|nr:hypothetical protein BCR33DRAFT_779851 [Rhizoclosmatium globosum]|eukprot:ORY52584.1 hypothetical protein BCR33DRAFT_779851 [Rhizoclosmatium globosum]
MEVDLVPQQLPFIEQGLHSLVLPGVKIPALQSKIIDLLDTYFCNKEIASILKTASAKHPNCGYQNGWVPAALLASFKSAKESRISPQAFVVTSKSCLPGAFEVSPDGNCLRRRVSFNQRNIADVVRGSVVLSSSCVLVNGIPKDAVDLDFISYVSEKYGSVERFQFSPRNLSLEFKSCHIQFKDPQSMIKLLAIASFTFEDHQVSIHASSFPSTTATNKKQITVAPSLPTFDFNHPSLTSRDPRSEPIKQKGQSAVQAAAILGYPLNRIVKFGPIDIAKTGFTTSSLQTLSRAEFEKLAPVAECIVREGEIFGYIRFKKGIAKEIVEMTMRHGGIGLGVLGDKVPLVAMQGEEERLFYEVAKERERVSGGNLAVAAIKAVKARRSLAVKQGSKRKGAKKGQNVSIKSKEPERKGNKRMANDEDEDEAMDGDQPSRTIAEIRKKRVKVDDLEELITGMGAFK